MNKTINIDEYIYKLNHQLTIIQDRKDLPIGLLSGKMGLCIYFYQLGRSNNNEVYGKIAEKLIDEIFAQIGTVSAIDIENGLSGIALGITYLIKNGYVQGDENSLLKDIDDEIFKQISFNRLEENISVLIQILYYIYIRKQSLKNEQDLLFNELAIQIINDLHSKTEQILHENTIVFNINTHLPLLLFVLSKIYQLNIYNNKIIKIIQEISPFILSKYAYLDSKKLLLLWGINQINSCIRDNRLTEFCNLLVSQININNLLDEFKNKNIFLNNGIAGICLLLLTMENNITQNLELNKFYIKAKEKIENSSIWELSANTEYLKAHIGLTGYCGAIMILNAINQTICE